MDISSGKQATRGSQKWLQVLINDCPSRINDLITKKIFDGQSREISWCSPLAEDDYREYQDEAFLTRLGIRVQNPLASFWPKGGPFGMV